MSGSRTTKICAIVMTVFSVLSLITMFYGAYLHDYYQLLTRDQVFIAPMLCIAIAILALIRGWAEEVDRGR